MRRQRGPEAHGDPFGFGAMDTTATGNNNNNNSGGGGGGGAPSRNQQQFRGGGTRKPGSNIADGPDEPIDWSKVPATIRTNFVDRAIRFGEAAQQLKNNKNSGGDDTKKQLKKIPAANSAPYQIWPADRQQAWRDEHRVTLHGLKAGDQSSAAQLPYLQPITELSSLRQVHSRLHDAFARFGFATPTPIQAQAWPLLFAGRDLIGIASTGSGKTLAFAVPGAAHALAQTEPLQRGDGPMLLVLAPTRELALQIDVESRKLFTALKEAHPASPPLRSLCIFGGMQRGAQLSSMQASPTLVVATPGRLLDLLNTRTVGLKRVVYVVLDEADRMLDMGFEPQIRTILSYVRTDRQTLMFSATWPTEVQQLAFDFTTQSTSAATTLRVQVGSDELHANADVTQHISFVKGDADKFPQLRLLLQRFTNKRILVFVKKRVDADELERRLHQAGFRNAYAFHGDKEQAERMEVLARFRKTTVGGILVATDVASRGLDIQELDVVINYDFPMTLEDYVHRIGRTGRAGATGDAFSFITKKEDQLNPWVAQELIELLQDAKQSVPNELKMWAADTMGRNKPDPGAVAEQQRQRKMNNSLKYQSGTRPSTADGKTGGGGVKWGGVDAGGEEKKKGGLFGSSTKESFDPFA